MIHVSRRLFLAGGLCGFGSAILRTARLPAAPPDKPPSTTRGWFWFLKT